jgi:prevent-host-death family protein
MRTVTIADLKNNLSRYLREVRRGEEVTVLSRDIPVARLIPVEPVRGFAEIRLPRPDAPALAEVPLPPRLTYEGDIAALLNDERREH